MSDFLKSTPEASATTTTDGSPAGNNNNHHVVSCFLDSLLVSGQWETALSMVMGGSDAHRLQSPLLPEHVLQVSKVQSIAGKWDNCVRLLATAAPIDSENHAAYRVPPQERLALVAADACARHRRWEEAIRICSQFVKAAPRQTVRRVGAEPNAAWFRHKDNQLRVLAHVQSRCPPHMRETLQSHVKGVTRELRHAPPAAYEKFRAAQEYGRQFDDSNHKLTHLLRNHGFSEGWLEALAIVSSAPIVTPVTLNIVIQILGLHRRETELIQLWCSRQLTSQPPFVEVPKWLLKLRHVPDSNKTPKALSEAALRCDSAMLANDMLATLTSVGGCGHSSLSSSSLSSSSAVTPLLMSLAKHHKRDGWRTALLWWQSLSRESPLRQHQKVGSYVAQTIAVSVHPHLVPPLSGKTSTDLIPHLSWAWRDALAILAENHHVHPARSIAYAMRVCAVAHTWRQAVLLLPPSMPLLQQRQHADELGFVRSLLCDRSARHWIPGDTVNAVERFLSRAALRTRI